MAVADTRLRGMIIAILGEQDPGKRVVMRWITCPVIMPCPWRRPVTSHQKEMKALGDD